MKELEGEVQRSKQNTLTKSQDEVNKSQTQTQHEKKPDTPFS